MEPRKQYLSRENFLMRVILPAIQGQSCPICLRFLDDDPRHHRRAAAVITGCLHAYCVECIRKWSEMMRRCPLCNGSFDSWFCKINLSSRSFFKEKLRSLEDHKKVVSGSDFSSRDWQRTVQRSRSELNADIRRSRALPRKRSFGGPDCVPSHVLAQRKLHWRASLYNQGMQAVPLSSTKCPKLSTSRGSCMKEKVLQRIEPWIQRELHAILEDPDPSVIVHVASSLYIANIEGPSNVGGNFLAPLQPFLHKWTNTFWHELRCFAESSLVMEAYDEVVEYVQSG
ncbi:hypothetical protein K2173_017609 [Erythroxylum novogranatense]|uniref:RING-type E3 ubiquitin transferase n=1 Tax=Erythroxylum novogranatense TaxID=1862640 RepID=A0AAV8TMS7_9ROSI|nr:hypothetical protein K2173_017609 [Erythroxylum novogranatense]